MKGQDARVKTLKIDGRDLGARSGETVLQVATENGIFIPRLCNIEGLSAVGACRLCMVEVEGKRGLFASCVTKVWEGMEVRTESERLSRYRKMILELLFSERNHVCAVCVSNGHCELQALAEKLGVDHVRFPYLYDKHSVDASHDRFVQDNNRCILCGRCVRVCAEIEGAHTWDFTGRGIKTRVITDLDEPWAKATSCTRCGKCVHVCPTGALIEKGQSVAEMAKRRQFLPYLTMMRKEGGR